MLIRPNNDTVPAYWLPLRAILFGAALVPAITSQRLAAEMPRLVRYEFEATVTEISDPLELFPSIRLGDAASGTITYDPLTTYDLSEPNVAHFYINPSWFQSATLVIQSSNGVDTAFLPDSQGAFPFNATMVNDLEDEDAFEETDGIAFFQTVIAPARFASEAPGISVDFLAPGTKFEALDDTLPDELILDDWPFAAVSFLDLLLVDESATQLVATIHTLRAVEIGRGDFNGSGGVDAEDLSIWQEEFSLAPAGGPAPILPYADADGDGDSDGNDFLVWQRNLSGSAIATAIPEPSGVLLTICMVVSGGTRRSFREKLRYRNFRRSNQRDLAMVGARSDEPADDHSSLKADLPITSLGALSRMRPTSILLCFNVMRRFLSIMSKSSGRGHLGCVCGIVAVLTLGKSLCHAQAIQWQQQLGTSVQDRGTGVAADFQGNVILGGVTFGNLARPNSFSDAFIAKYDASGQALWTRQLGTDGDEEFGGVTTDVSGNVIVSGYTSAGLGGSNAGEFDAYLAKYSPGGQMLWTRQFGTSRYDTGTGVTTDAAGNIYQAGYTTGAFNGTNAGGWDAYLRKTDPAGTVIWTRQIGTAAADVTVDAATDGQGNIYLLGNTGGSLQGSTPDEGSVFLGKYDENGNLQWKRQFGGAANLFPNAVVADALGNVFFSGFASNLDGASSGEGFNAFLSKYDSAGNPQWTRQLGTNGDDRGTGLATDGLGNVFLSGWTSGELAGPIIGGTDAYLAKYDSSGNLRWAHQFGSPLNESDGASSFDGLGNIFVAGTRDADLQGLDGFRRGDAYVVKFTAVPEPASELLLSVAALFSFTSLRNISRRRR